MSTDIASRRIDVVCAGLLVADTFAPVLHALPAPGELVVVDDFLQEPGGCAANTAITLASLGVDVAVAATVGDDEKGAWLHRILESRGVRADRIVHTDLRPTSRTVILTVEGDDRRYIHSPGANGVLDARMIGAAGAGARILVVGGFLDLPAVDPDELARELAILRSDGTLVALDVVVPDDEEGGLEALRAVLPHVDLCLPNRDEAEHLLGIADPVAQAEALLDLGAGGVVITCGSDGALYRDAGQTLRVHPAPVDYVDGSGAGDAFTAGLVAGFLEEWPVDASLAFAAALGASACRSLGCTTSLFTREEALAYAQDVRVEQIGAGARR